MQSKSRMISKLALVLLSLIVLELVLIRDQVQPVKAIKKKILLKKLKKLLPLMALLKPKKKIILVPIPFPMFKDKPGHYAHGQHGVRRPMAMSMVAADATPNYMSMDAGDQPPLVGLPVDGSPPIQMLPMSMSPTSIEPIVASMVAQPGGANASTPLSSMMMMPSMTLSIQTDAGGASSAVQLSAHSPSNSSLANLQRRPPGNKHQYHYQQQQQQQQQLDDWTEHNYSPAWAPARPSPASPAKLLRNQKQRKPERQQQRQKQPQADEWRLSNQLRLLPMLVRQSPAGKIHQQSPQQQQQPPVVQQVNLMQQHIQQALEQEDLVAVGPAKLVPVYQSASGELHMSPPVGEREEAAEPNREGQAGGAELNSEVQTIGQPAKLSDTPASAPPVAESAAVKGKQRQQQQPKRQLSAQY